MRRYLGLDLGTKTCGIACTDRSNTIVIPYKTIRFQKEDYDDALKQIASIIEEQQITDIALGLPINMDGSKGFAAERSMNFAKKLEKLGINVTMIDERLTSVMAHQILHNCDLKEKNFRDKVDMESACLILESYLRSLS